MTIGIDTGVENSRTAAMLMYTVQARPGVPTRPNVRAPSATRPTTNHEDSRSGTFSAIRRSLRYRTIITTYSAPNSTVLASPSCPLASSRSRHSASNGVIRRISHRTAIDTVIGTCHGDVSGSAARVVGGSVAVIPPAAFRWRGSPPPPEGRHPPGGLAHPPPSAPPEKPPPPPRRGPRLPP